MVSSAARVCGSVVECASARHCAAVSFRSYLLSAMGCVFRRNPDAGAIAGLAVGSVPAQARRRCDRHHTYVDMGNAAARGATAVVRATHGGRADENNASRQRAGITPLVRVDTAMGEAT